MLLAGFYQDIAMNDAQPLAQIKGTIVLAGAGKMGGAMLSGWLARGLDAKRVAVIERKYAGPKIEESSWPSSGDGEGFGFDEAAGLAQTALWP